MKAYLSVMWSFYDPIDINVDDITLLSAEQVKELGGSLSFLRSDGESWWLRSPGSSKCYAKAVGSLGDVTEVSVDCENVEIRPALKIRSLDDTVLDVGDEVEIAGYDCVILSGGYAFFEKAVGSGAFRHDCNAEDANDYAASDIKKWLEEWAKEHILNAVDADD